MIGAPVAFGDAVSPVPSAATFAATIAMVMPATLVTPPLLKAAFVKSSGNPGHVGVGPGG